MPTTIAPIMPSGDKEFETLPEDTYRVRITEVEDQERPQYENPQETEQVHQFTFEVVEGDEEGKTVRAWARPSLFAGSSGANASTLYKILCAVYRKELNDEELRGVTAATINQMVGNTLVVLVKEVTNQQGQKRNRIENYMKDKEGEAPVLGAEEDIPVIDQDGNVPF